MANITAFGDRYFGLLDFSRDKLVKSTYYTVYKYPRIFSRNYVSETEWSQHMQDQFIGETFYVVKFDVSERDVIKSWYEWRLDRTSHKLHTCFMLPYSLDRLIQNAVAGLLLDTLFIQVAAGCVVWEAIPRRGE